MDESWMCSGGNWLFFVMYKRDVCQCLSLNDKSFMENLWFALLWNFKGKGNKLNMWFQFPNLPYFYTSTCKETNYWFDIRKHVSEKWREYLGTNPIKTVLKITVCMAYTDGNLPLDHVRLSLLETQLAQ